MIWYLAFCHACMDRQINIVYVLKSHYPSVWELHFNKVEIPFEGIPFGRFAGVIICCLVCVIIVPPWFEYVISKRSVSLMKFIGQRI